MEKRTLGKTDIAVTKICLGTMTWGCQNTQDDAFEQMDYAVEQGVNFFDTAELYAIPPEAETQGLTETYIGNWFARSGKRADIVLASKIAGRNPGLSWIRGGNQKFDKEQLNEALNGSLKRLQTDYIDLYQLHWPIRPTPKFGIRGFKNDIDELNSSGDYTVYEEMFLETIQALNDFIKQGKIRHYGLSNETPWGAMRYLELAHANGLPTPVSIQNPYNLLDRTYEYGLAEISIREQCGLLAYSPLAAGSLSGKYFNGQRPEGTRWAIDFRSSRYDKPNAENAVKEYHSIAKQFGLDPCQMALAFVASRPFMTAAIIGATSMKQLKSNIASHSITLNDDVLAAIEAVHDVVPNPCP